MYCVADRSHVIAYVIFYYATLKWSKFDTFLVKLWSWNISYITAICMQNLWGSTVLTTTTGYLLCDDCLLIYQILPKKLTAISTYKPRSTFNDILIFSWIAAWIPNSLFDHIPVLTDVYEISPYATFAGGAAAVSGGARAYTLQLRALARHDDDAAPPLNPACCDGETWRYAIVYYQGNTFIVGIL